jgi:uncharacterized membrane protein
VEKTSTGLQENVAGLLCYVGAWVTGIIFLILEPKNRFVRFHAMQSIVTFAGLSIIGFVIGLMPGILFFGEAMLRAGLGVLGFILWIVLMVKAYQGVLYKLPVAGDLAEQFLGKP